MITEQECLSLKRKLTDRYIRECIDIDLSGYFGETLVEKLYNYFHPGPHICKTCGKPTEFRSFSKGYREYCCRKCATDSPERMEHIRQTCVERYGRPYSVNVEKAKQTCLERYGVEHASQTEEAKEKCRRTCLEKYGREYPLDQEKSKQTCLERYGVEHISQVASTVEKVRQTKMERYGTPGYCNPEKARQTCLERYGVPSASCLMEIQQKSKQTRLERYGNPNYRNTDKAKQTCLERYGVTCSLHAPGIKEKVEATFIKRYGVENPMQNPKVISKFSESCMEKYGVPYGIFNTDPGYSKDSQILFDQLQTHFPNAIYATHGGEYKVGPYLLDWYDPDSNVAIEYNGDYWHANPKTHAANWVHPIKKCTAQEIWQHDIEKLEYVLGQGIAIFVVWESDKHEIENIIDTIKKLQK